VRLKEAPSKVTTAELDEIDDSPILVKTSEVIAAAEEIREKRALPPVPGKTVKFHEMAAWLKLLGEEAAERVTVWVYRRNPVINRQLVNPDADNNIDTLFGSFNNLTEDYMKDVHGGGNYKFVIKDEDKPKTQKGGLFEAVLSIEMQDCPPKLDLREVDWDHPYNKGFKSWCKAKRWINDQCMPIIEQQSPAGAPVTNGVDANMLKMMLDFTAKMSEKEQAALKTKIGGEDAVSKSMHELFLEKLKQENPNSQMQTVVQMISAMNGMNKPDNTMATVLPLIIKMMDDSRAAADRQMTIMLEMFKSQQQAPQKEEVDEVDRLHKLLAIAKEIKGGSAAPEKTVTESVLEVVGNVLPGVLNVVGQMMQQNAAAKGMTGAPQQAAPPQANKPNNMAMVEERNRQIPAPQQQVSEATMTDRDKAVQMIQAFTPQIMTHLAGEGYEFGLWIAQGYGDMIASGIGRLGVDKLIDASKSVPEFWQQIEASYGEAHYRKWLDSVCRYKEIVAELDKEDEREAVN